MRLVHTTVGLVALLLTRHCSSVALGGKPAGVIRAEEADPLQDIVTWDEHSIFVRGERVLFYSGEFHPFRLPVADLWLDVFQKIKALGYTGVSFYTDWALLEGDPGTFTADGIFAFEPFFQAASEAGIYLLARPGPYINAEVSGGGYPGWLQRVPGMLRTNASTYLDATNLYVQSIAEIVAKAQITNGGPIILLQPENEYTHPYGDIVFPNKEYFAYVEQQYRKAGIVVPFITNDAGPTGLFAPSSGLGSADIYGHDSYPLGFDCANPYTWPDNHLPTNFRTLHEAQSPTTPYSIVEFQGGSFDPWGGSGFTKCTTLLNQEFERVFYKNDFSFGVTIFNLYMTYGGTNWGNLGHPGGYTSYDYGAVIKEDLTVTREKYSEAKLLANFLNASPAYLTATPGHGRNGSYVNTSTIEVTPLFGNGTRTNFYVARHAAYNSLQSTQYNIRVSTSSGNITLPQLGGALTLDGRDSKIHVTDYDLGGTNLIYSTAEIFTWQNYSSGSVLVLYGGAGETHEFALPASVGNYSISGNPSVKVKTISGTHVVQWQVSPTRSVATFGGGELTIYLLWRNDVYNWWALELPASSPIGNFTSPSKSKLIVSGGYLLRSASVENKSVFLNGDINSTATLEVIGVEPAYSESVYLNDLPVDFTITSTNTLAFNASYKNTSVSLPDFAGVYFKMIDSLPEVSNSYNDSAWALCNHSSSVNPLKLSTPTSLYASDYGYHTGSLVYHGHFTAKSAGFPTLQLKTQGGYAYGHSIWLNSTFVASWPGISTAENYTHSYQLPKLRGGRNYVITVLVDHMGLDENFNPGLDSMKNPRGILSYNLTGYPQSAITWKITGNLGGEQYIDKARGPLNEGGLFAERQGYHLPSPPSSNWSTGNPITGITHAGVAFYTTSFNLSVPAGYDIPLSFRFTNSSSLTHDPNGSQTPAKFRSLLFVNGYQFGKYVNHIGPQTDFSVPEGILNYQGENWIAVSIWAMEDSGARLDNFELVAGHPVMTGRRKVGLSPMPAWSERAGAY